MAATKPPIGAWAVEFRDSLQYQSKDTLWYWHEQFMLWERAHPFYRTYSYHEMLLRVTNWLRITGRACDQRTAYDVTNCVAGASAIDRDVKLPSWLTASGRGRDYIVMRDGLVSPTVLAEGRGKPLPHTPDWFSMTYLPYAYQAGAKCPIWEDWLKRRVPDAASRLFLQEWAGYLLTPDYSRQCALLLKGPEGTGKSTFCRMMTRLIGQQNVSSVGLEKWGSPFAIADVVGRMMNVIGEIPAGKVGATAEKVFKEWIGGDLITYEPKHSKQYQAEPLARLMLAMNEWPQFHDTTGAVWRRLRVVLMNQHIDRDEYDLELELRMEAELPGIFNWALAGLRRWRKTSHWTKVMTGEDELVEARAENQNYIQFIEDCLTAKPGGFAAWERILSAYKFWCSKQGYTPFGNKRSFGEAICKLHHAKRMHKRVGTTTMRGFGGVILTATAKGDQA